MKDKEDSGQMAGGGRKPWYEELRTVGLVRDGRGELEDKNIGPAIGCLMLLVKVRDTGKGTAL